MATVIEHHPVSIALADTGRLQRHFLNKRSHLPDVAELGDEDYAEYEQHAIFHDVFLTGGEICACGPPLVNLARELLPMRCRVLAPNGSASEPLRHRMRNGERVVTHHFRLPKELVDARELRISIDFASGQRFEIPLTRPALPPVFLQFATMQKNNPFEWIADWLAHAARIDVDRVLLYDNGSDDVDQLVERLAGLDKAPTIVLVHWPYRYGPLRSYYNRFSQPSQIAHSHLCLGASEWSGNLDIDEYLVSGDGYDLPTRLKDCRPSTGLLRLDNWLMPAVASDDLSAPPGDGGGVANANADADAVSAETANTANVDATSAGAEVSDAANMGAVDQGTPNENDAMPTARSFTWRVRASRGKAHKYLARRRALREPRIHNARLRLGYRRVHPDVDDIGFLHFVALTTGWKLYWDRQTRIPPDPAIHVEDTRIRDSLALLDAQRNENEGKP